MKKQCKGRVIKKEVLIGGRPLVRNAHPNPTTVPTGESPVVQF